MFVKNLSILPGRTYGASRMYEIGAIIYEVDRKQQASRAFRQSSEQTTSGFLVLSGWHSSWIIPDPLLSPQILNKNLNLLLTE